MAPHLRYSGLGNRGKVVLLCLLLSLVMFITSFTTCALSKQPERHSSQFLWRRRLLDEELEAGQQEEPIKKTTKSTTTSYSSSLASSSGSKNKTKLLKPSSSSTDSTDSSKSHPTTKSVKTSYSNGDDAELVKAISGSATNKAKAFKSTDALLYNSKGEADGSTQLVKTKLKKKLNSTSKATTSSDSINPSSVSIKKSPDLIKSGSAQKNKTSKSSTNKKTQLELEKIKKKEGSEVIKQSSDTSTARLTNQEKKPTLKSNSDKNKKKNPTPTTITSSSSANTSKKQNTKKLPQPSWIYNSDEEDDLVSELRDLPTKFHQTFVPDLHRISSSSRLYLTKANMQFTKGYIKRYVGNKYAPAVATAISCSFIIIPLLLVSLLFNRIKAYFSLQKLLIFVQVYLSIYFSILCLSSLVTGLEPLRFFYATSPSTYVWLQVLQTLGYVMYLLLRLMYLVLVFSTDGGLGSKFLGLAQTFVGFSVGLHYYVTVFHRMVLHQPPKTNWKVHGIYAACFLVICLCARAERRKKAYLEEGGEEGKKS